MPRFIGKPKSKAATPYDPPNAIESEAERNSAYVAEVYVNRRKVGEHRAGSREAALSQADADEQKYKGARTSIVLRKAPRGKK